MTDNWKQVGDAWRPTKEFIDVCYELRTVIEPAWTRAAIQS